MSKFTSLIINTIRGSSKDNAVPADAEREAIKLYEDLVQAGMPRPEAAKRREQFLARLRRGTEEYELEN